MKGLPAFISLMFLLIAAAGCGVVWTVDNFLTKGPLKQETSIVIHSGSSLSVIADKLHDEGVIRHPLIFRGGAMLMGYANTLKAGEYMFPPRISPKGALKLMNEGKTLQHFITIPEGLTSAQIVDLLMKEDKLTGDIPAVPAEGTLLPETYSFSRGDTRKSVIHHMRDAMQEAMKDLWPTRRPGLPISTPQEAITLASVVEKETGIPEERPRVAGVFVNRLNQGIPLQTDPTVIYALTNGSGALGRPLTRADLKTDSPYNTYQNPGLPPGPIANPGRASLKAVMQPEEHDYLFFVADGTGGHVFAKTLSEHNKNAARWRKIRDGKASPDMDADLFDTTPDDAPIDDAANDNTADEAGQPAPAQQKNPLALPLPGEE